VTTGITSGLSERGLVRVRVRNMVRTRVRVRAVSQVARVYPTVSVPVIDR